MRGRCFIASKLCVHAKPLFFFSPNEYLKQTRIRVIPRDCVTAYNRRHYGARARQSISPISIVTQSCYTNHNDDRYTAMIYSVIAGVRSCADRTNLNRIDHVADRTGPGTLCVQNGGCRVLACGESRASEDNGCCYDRIKEDFQYSCGRARGKFFDRL